MEKYQVWTVVLNRDRSINNEELHFETENKLEALKKAERLNGEVRLYANEFDYNLITG